MADNMINIDDVINKVNSETVAIASCTVVHSKKGSRADIDETSKKLNDFLEKNYALEFKGSDITAARIIGIFSWYGSKLNFPENSDLNIKDKQSTLKILEIRNYDAATQQDNRATLIMSINCNELENVFKGISSFYMAEGYFLHPNVREMGRQVNPESKTMF